MCLLFEQFTVIRKISSVKSHNSNYKYMQNVYLLFLRNRLDVRNVKVKHTDIHRSVFSPNL